MRYVLLVLTLFLISCTTSRSQVVEIKCGELLFSREITDTISDVGFIIVDQTSIVLRDTSYTNPIGVYPTRCGIRVISTRPTR